MKMKRSESSKNCAICYSSVDSPDQSDDSDDDDDGESSVSSLSSSLSENLESPLNVIFILRHIFEVNQEQLELYLKECGHPGHWIKLCGQCEEDISNVRKIFACLHEVQRNLKRTKSVIQERIHVSEEEELTGETKAGVEKILYECRANFDRRRKYPFQEGDEKAKALALKIQANNDPQNHIKKELDDYPLVEPRDTFTDYVDDDPLDPGDTYENDLGDFNLDYGIDHGISTGSLSSEPGHSFENNTGPLSESDPAQKFSSTGTFTNDNGLLEPKEEKFSEDCHNNFILSDNCEPDESVKTTKNIMSRPMPLSRKRKRPENSTSRPPEVKKEASSVIIA